jgi:hypothetical protein
MKLWHALDTKLFQKTYLEYCKTYWVSNIYASRKSKMYLWIYVIPWFIFMSFLTTFIIWIVIQWFDKTTSLQMMVLFIIIWIIITILLDVNLIRRYINYRCDFTIVTPTDILNYDQLGIFTRNIRSIPKSKISSIATLREWFMHNIFNTGTLSILMLWWSEDWTIKIKFVHKPDKTREIIMSIINSIE